MVLIAGIASNLVIASGSGNLKVTMEKASNEVTAVEISSISLSNFKIELKNAYGEKLYSTATAAPTNGLKKKYNFSGLEDGIYWYSVRMDNESTTKKLEIANGNVEVLDIRKSIEPTYIFEDRMLKVSYLNPQKEEAKLYVYDSSDNLLTEAEIGSDFAIHKAVDFTNKKNDTYNVIISSDMELHEYTVLVE